MTNQHFIELAKALKFERPGLNWNTHKKLQWDLCVKAVANACKNYKGFDRVQFISECGNLFYA